MVQDFLKNNRGINDGGDLPEEYMSSLYERIQTNEIKMKVRSHHRWLCQSRLLDGGTCISMFAWHDGTKAQLVHTVQGAGVAILTCAALSSCNAFCSVH